MENRYQKFLKNTLQVGLQELYDNPFIKEAAGIPRPTFEILTRAFRSGLPQDLLVNLPEHNLNNKEYLEALIKRIDFLLSPGRIGEPEETTLSNMPPLANLLPAYERARKSKEDLEKQKVNWRQEFDRQVDKYNRELVARLTAQLTEKFPELKDKPQTEVIVKDLVDKVTASLPEISQPYEGTATVLSQKIEETLKTEFSLDEAFSKLTEDSRVKEFSQEIAGQESGEVWNLKGRQLLSERGPAYRPVGDQIEVVIDAYFPDLASNEALVGELKRRVLSRLSLPALSALSPEEFKSEYRNEISAILKSPEFRTITKEYQDRLVSALIEETGETAQIYSKSSQATMAGGEIPTISPARGIPPTGEEEPTFPGRFGRAWVASHPTDFLFFGLSKPSLKTIPSSVLGLTMDIIGIVPPTQTAMMMGYLGYDEKRLTELIGGYSLKAQTLEPGSKEQAAYQSMADFLSGIQSFKQKAPAILRPFISLGGVYGKFQLFNLRLAHYTGISPFQLLELTAKYGGPGFSYGVETALKIIASRLLGAGLHASLPGLFPYDELSMEVYFKYGPKGLIKSTRGFIFKKVGALRQRFAGKFLKTAVGKAFKTLVEKLGLSALLGILTGGASLAVQIIWLLFKKFWKWIVGALGIFLLWLISQLGTIAGILTFLGGMVLGGIIGSFFGPWGTVVGVIVGPVILGGLFTLIKNSFFPAGTAISAPGLGAGGIGAVPSLTPNAIIAPVTMVGIGGAAILLSTITSSSFFLQEKAFLAPIFYADCKVTDIHKTDTITPENKAVFVAKWSSAKPNSLLTQKIDEVISQAKAAGFNPALAVAIWGEETHFSSYGEIVDGNEIVPGNDFGCGTPDLCGSSMPKDFQESLDCFFGQKKGGCNNTCLTKTDFKSFMECYGPAASHPNFASNVLAFYRQLVPSGPDAIVCPGGTTSEYASRLLNFLRDCYGEFVNQKSVISTDNGNMGNCLRKKGVIEQAITEIISSVDTYGALQCVGFAQAVEAATGGTLQNTSYPSAKDYYRYGVPGYHNIPVGDKNVRVGDIAVWDNPGGPGHMAVVVEVATDLSWIRIDQAIGTDNGRVNENKLPFPHSNLLGFLRRR